MKVLRTALPLLALLSVAVSIAAGATATASWVAPTTYSDGSSLPISDIDHYTLTWAPASGQSGPSGSMNVAAGTISQTVNALCGSTTFTISVTTTATARYPNATSTPSGPVPYASGIACTPNPPTGLAVH